MALLFDLDTEPATGPIGRSSASADPADVAFARFSDHIATLEPKAGLQRLRRYRARLTALETSLAKRLTRETGSDRAVKAALDDGKTSKQAIDKAAKRGEAAAENPDLIDQVAAGDLSEEQLDVIADTSAKTGGAAALDEDFIAEVAAVNPDKGKDVAKRFLDKRADPDGKQSEHDRQRRDRKAFNYYSKRDGLPVIALGSDAAANKAMWDAIKKRANELYEADGGKDLATGLHPRTTDQRRLDAAYELICGVTTTPTGTIHQPRHGTKRGTGRPQIFVGLTLDKYLGLDPAALAEHIGLGLIPDSVLAEYLEHADIIGVLYDRNGQPLWLGRSKRHASLMQRYALIARDKACVKCGADHATCEVHHLMPWSAPGKGETNLDQLVLLCGPCHRQLHNLNQTLYRDKHNRWQTRPATPDETPPTQPEYTHRE